jgi:hypothetical protein
MLGRSVAAGRDGQHLLGMLANAGPSIGWPLIYPGGITRQSSLA